MIADIKRNAETRMEKGVKSLQDELAKVHSGRANPSLLEHIVVSYYGNNTPLNQVASVTVADARTLLVTPWEKAIIPTIEKAIMIANLGLNPVTAGNAIRVPLPVLSEERRKEMVKGIKDEAERARVSIRNVRRDANNELKEQLKEKTISEDEERRAQEDIQKMTDKAIAEVEKILMAKEQVLLKI